jgi:hypothetical protein
VLVWKRNDKFFGGIRELGILESSRDITALWHQVDERKQEIIKKFVEGGIEDELPPPIKNAGSFPGFHVLGGKDNSGSQGRQHSRGDGGIHVIVVKMLVVTAGVLLCLFAASQFLEATVLKLTSRKMLLQTIQSYASSLEALPEEKRQEVHHLLQTIVTSLRPFARDIQPLLSDLSTSNCGDRLSENALAAEKAPGQKKLP